MQLVLVNCAWNARDGHCGISQDESARLRSCTSGWSKICTYLPITIVLVIFFHAFKQSSEVNPAVASTPHRSL